MDNVAQQVAEIMEGSARKHIDSKLGELIDGFTNVLTGDADIDGSKKGFTIHDQFNQRLYTKYDLVRIVRKMLIDVRGIPDRLINTHSPIDVINQYDDLM